MMVDTCYLNMFGSLLTGHFSTTVKKWPWFKSMGSAGDFIDRMGYFLDEEVGVQGKQLIVMGMTFDGDDPICIKFVYTMYGI